MAPWLDDAPSRAVLGMLTGGGHQAWFVGGCVRNALLGAPVDDLDLSTDAHPTRVLALAEAAGLTAHPTGIDHGTITVVAEGRPYEVTTFRRDVETDGRHAVVAFAETLEEDAQRRDFTMNALFAAPDGTIADPVGGLPDLTVRRVRFIGDPEQRIREDYLRILRFFRFFAWYGEDLDADGLAACAALADGMERLSAERVTAEVLKLLAAPRPVRALAAMEQSGVLHRLLPGASSALLGPLTELEREVDPITRLAALGGETERLRLSKKAQRKLEVLRESLSDTSTPRVLGATYGEASGRAALYLRYAVKSVPYPDDALEEIARGAAATFPVAAKDLMPTYQGPALGAKLDELRAAWLASDLMLTRDELLARA
ncbi:MAG: CCA tRNA nucleotidyltransferase [Shimia sp.]